jgi:hypothetical protein
MKHGVSLERREGQWKSQPEGGDGDDDGPIHYEPMGRVGMGWQYKFFNSTLFYLIKFSRVFFLINLRFKDR